MVVGLYRNASAFDSMQGIQRVVQEIQKNLLQQILIDQHTGKIGRNFGSQFHSGTLDFVSSSLNTSSKMKESDIERRSNFVCRAKRSRLSMICFMRRASRRITSAPRRVPSSCAEPEIISAYPSTAVRGLFSSCPAPETSLPNPASFSETTS